MAENKPVARVAEVHMSRYTLEWTDGPLPEGTLLYAAPHRSPAEQVPESARTGDSMEYPATISGHAISTPAPAAGPSVSAENEALRAIINDLAMMCRRLSYAAKQAGKETLSRQCDELLKKHGLSGSVLRTDAATTESTEGPSAAEEFASAWNNEARDVLAMRKLHLRHAEELDRLRAENEKLKAAARRRDALERVISQLPSKRTAVEIFFRAAELEKEPRT